MPAKLQLKEGDIIDPNNNLIYIRDVQRINPHRRRVGVYDIQYDEYFEASLNDLRTGHTKHSLTTSYALRNGKNIRWNPGETRKIKGQPILFLKEIEPFIYKTPEGKNHRYRRGRFQNLDTNIIFECGVNSAKSGSSSGTRKSRGERTISLILEELDISFSHQHVFYDCRNSNNRVLYFDFYLPDYNCCIEYDGEQHFVGWKRDKSTLEQIHKNDEVKNSYCLEKNIKLVRIPYTDLNKINKEYLVQKMKEQNVTLSKADSLTIVPDGSSPLINIK